MKTTFFSFFLFIACALCSCSGGSSDNSSVKDVVALIDAGTEQSLQIEAGTLNISDIPEADFFNTPNGNIFANAKILAVIKANPDYKLTSADKEMLTAAVEKYFGSKSVEETSTSFGAAASAINDMGLSNAKKAINEAKTLNDLYKIGLANEWV